MKKLKLETKYCQLETIKMAYNEYGAGPDLLLIHPNSASKSTWDELRQTIFKNHHTIAIDLRGHGESVSIDEKLTYSDSSQDVLDFAHEMNLKDAKVVGYSDGAIIILYMAGQEPDYFGKMVAISPNLTEESVRPGWRRMFKVILAITKVFHRIGLVSKAVVLRTEMMMHEQYLAYEPLKNVTEQLLIIYAEHDICVAEHFNEMKKLIPNAKFEEIEKVNHGTIIRNKKTLEVMKEFLKKD